MSNQTCVCKAPVHSNWLRRCAGAAGLSILLGMGGVFFTPAAAQTSSAMLLTASQAEVVVLRVFLNTVDKGDVFVLKSESRGFLIKVDDLKAFGLREPSGLTAVFDNESYLALGSLKGVTFLFDSNSLSLNLTAEPQLLVSSAISVRGQRRSSISSAGENSAFFNYALTSNYGNAASTSRIGLAGELGVRWTDYLFLTDVATINSPDSSRLVRLMSSVTKDDRDNFNRLIIGDFLTPSRDFGSSLALGGISFSKVYGLDPGFIQFPTQSVSGSVASPSDLEVYLDGQRIRTERLQPGNFQLQDIVAYGGSRNIQLLLRDAFGRVQQLNYSVYFSDLPLQNGLHEYSYNFGALRRQYGLQSNSYGAAAFTMFHRFGFSDSLTMGWRADASSELINMGPSLTAVLGNYGVVNLALAGSSFSGEKGYAAQGSYTYDSKNWAISMSARRDSARYASLSDSVKLSSRHYEANLSGSYRLTHNASISGSHSLFTSREPGPTLTAPIQAPSLFLTGKRSVSSLSYATSLAALQAQLNVMVSRIKEDALPTRNELFFGLNFLLDRNYTASASYRADRNGRAESIRFTKGTPVGEGLGYDLSLDRSSAGGGSQQVRSNIQYNTPAATVRFEGGQYLTQGQNVGDQRVTLAGAVAAVGGEFGFSRPITGSYAIVKVGQEQGVTVSVEGQKAGTTNSRGVVVVPNLNANYENSISIDSDALPINLSLTTALKKVTPALRSGKLLNFDPKKIQAFTGKLVVNDAGNQKGIEFFEIEFSAGGMPQKILTGRGGEFYVENIPAGAYRATANNGSAMCNFLLSFPASADISVDLGTISCGLQSVLK